MIHKQAFSFITCFKVLHSMCSHTQTLTNKAKTKTWQSFETTDMRFSHRNRENISDSYTVEPP